MYYVKVVNASDVLGLVEYLDNMDVPVTYGDADLTLVRLDKLKDWDDIPRRLLSELEGVAAWEGNVFINLEG